MVANICFDGIDKLVDNILHNVPQSNTLLQIKFPTH